jgi:dTDP-glucose pyrophosphorylase
MKNIKINKSTSILNALKKMNIVGTKCLVVVDKNKTFLGTLTDGDLRRLILRNKNLNLKINNSYNQKSIFYYEKTMNLKKIKKEMMYKKIDLIPILDQKKKLKSYITLNSDLSYPFKVSNKKIKNPVVIMAGGKGTRLDPFTRVLPKPLIPVGDQTMIEKIINGFSRQGFQNFFLTLNYKSKIIENYLSDVFKNIKVSYVKEKKFLGTAGSLSLLKPKNKEDIIITNCDTIIEVSYREVLDYHKKNKYDLTVVASTKEFEVPYGTCVINDKGELKKLKEKPKYNLLVNVGFYILKPELLRLIKKNNYLSMTDFINDLQSKNYKIGVYPCHENFWKDIGQWEEYEKSLKNLRY